MQHKVKVTVIDKKLYPELQARYCADPEAGACPCYNVGDEFVFERYGNADDFWHMGLGTLARTSADPDSVAGGPKMPHCSEAPYRRGGNPTAFCFIRWIWNTFAHHTGKAGLELYDT